MSDQAPEDWPERLNDLAVGGDDPASRNTDRLNAQDFVRLYGQDYIWTPETKWLVWNGRRWAEDVERTRELRCGDLADALWRLAELTPDDDAAGVIRGRAKKLESVGGKAGCLDFVEPMITKSIKAFDKNTHLLNCPNGTVDLRTGVLRGAERGDLITRMCPVPYDPAAYDPVWYQVWSDAFKGDQDMMRYLVRFAGYALTGEISEKAILVVHGPTNGGKSTITEALYRVLGDSAEGGYASTWPADMIQAGANITRDYLMDKVRGTRMIIVAELERGSRMADSFVKQVSGGDAMNCRQVYKVPYDYRPEAKLVMHSNYVPKSTDPAVHGRLKLLPFENPPRRTAEGILGVLDELYGRRNGDGRHGPDPRVREHLEGSESARRAILAWAVIGARKWYEEGLGSTPWLAAAMERYITDSDHVYAFMQECLEEFEYETPSPGRLSDPRLEGSIDVDQVWSLYQMWAFENVQRPFKRRLFETAMEERGVRKGKYPYRQGRYRWFGFRQRMDDEAVSPGL